MQGEPTPDLHIVGATSIFSFILHVGSMTRLSFIYLNSFHFVSLGDSCFNNSKWFIDLSWFINLSWFVNLSWFIDRCVSIDHLHTISYVILSKIST